MKRKASGVQKPDESREIDFMTITFAEAVENHAGMQQIGEKFKRGIPSECLASFRNSQEYVVHEMTYEDNTAVVLVIPGGVGKLLGKRDDATSWLELLYEEVRQQPFDNQFFDCKKKKVFHKHGRLNNCFADFDQEPDITVGKLSLIHI